MHVRELYVKHQTRPETYTGGGTRCWSVNASIILNVPFFGGIFIHSRAIDREKTGAYAI